MSIQDAKPSRPLARIDHIRAASAEVYRTDARKVLGQAELIHDLTEAVNPSSSTSSVESIPTMQGVQAVLPSENPAKHDTGAWKARNRNLNTGDGESFDDSRPFLLESLPYRAPDGTPVLWSSRVRARALLRQAESIGESLTLVRRTQAEADKPKHHIAWVKGAPHPLTLGKYTPDGEGDRDPLKLACASAGAVSRDMTPESTLALQAIARVRASDRDLCSSVEDRLTVLTPKHRGKRGGRRGKASQR
jgi:hypothetical protein